MVLYKKSFRKKVNKSTKKTSTRRKPSVTAVKKIVKQAISRAVENKSIQYYQPPRALYTYGAANWLVNNVFPLSPYSTYLNLAQGVTSGTRVGNVVTCKRLMFAGTIFPNSYNAGTNPTPRPQMVKMWIIYDRESPAIDPVPGSDFLQLGGSTVALTNSLTDITADINSDRFRVLTTRIFKIGHANYGGTGINVGAQSFSNNDYKLNAMFSINLTKYMVKKIKFNDNTVNPTSRGLFAVIQSVNADGASAATTDQPLYMSFTSALTYEDA